MVLLIISAFPIGNCHGLRFVHSVLGGGARPGGGVRRRGSWAWPWSPRSARPPLSSRCRRVFRLPWLGGSLVDRLGCPRSCGRRFVQRPVAGPVLPWALGVLGGGLSCGFVCCCVCCFVCVKIKSVAARWSPRCQDLQLLPLPDVSGSRWPGLTTSWVAVRRESCRTARCPYGRGLDPNTIPRGVQD